MGVDLSKAGPETVGKSLYEGMFLVDSAEAAADWDAAVATIRNVLERAEAEIVSIRKWDERRLAYKINGKTRGMYILCYFRVAGTRIQEIEKNIQLSMTIWRALILNTAQQTEEDITKETPAMLAEKQQQLAESVAQSAPLKQSDDKEEMQETEAEQPDGSEQAPKVRVSEKKVTKPTSTQAAEPELAADASEDHQGQRQAGADENVEEQDSADATAG